MEFDLNILLIVIPFIFLGGFVDSIAGGGGVINMAGFMLTGLPMHYIFGVNKTQGLFGTGVAMFNYIRNKHFRKEFVLFSVIGSLVGSLIGAQIALFLSDQTLRICMTIVLPVVALLMVSGKMPKYQEILTEKKKISILSLVIGLTIGFYDGVFGPGTGTFFIIAFGMCGLTMLEANGNSKIVNFVSNLAAASTFIFSGKIIIWLVIPCIITSVIANYLGSRLTIKNGGKIMKPVMIFVLALLFIKTIFELVG